ncbi:MAG TPA: DsbA family oxidoreductase [Caulobacteraceae bacterium]
MARPLHIDFIADVVCPWCYIGWRRLDRALALRPDVDADVVWRPYQLDPSIPEEGVDRRAYMAAKFPDPERRKAAAEVLATSAAEDGLDLKLADIAVSPNTNAAHRLIRWAAGQGLQRPVLEGVLAAYFTELKDIGDPVVLAEIGEAGGLDRMTVLKLLAEGADKETITREHMMAVRAGVTGVPCMIFGGKVAAVGAEAPERLALAIDKALEMAA